jgi:hypothetical protein
MRKEVALIIFLSVAPFFISAGGFVGALRFLPSPSNGEIMGVFLAAILGAIFGGFIGNISCPDKSQPGGWSCNLLPFFSTIWGCAIGILVVSFWMSLYLKSA